MTAGRRIFAETLDVSHETLEKFDLYAAELEKWQARQNLVGPGTLASVWTRHFLDSGQLASAYSRLKAPASPPVWVDIGSGAGFPGLVIAILAGWPVHLIEKSQKKCAFLRHVARRTDAPVTVHQARAEDIPGLGADVVTSRALASVAKQLPLALRHLGEKGEIWLLKGQDVDEELTEAAISWNMKTEKLASLSDPAGQIIRMRDISRVKA